MLVPCLTLAFCICPHHSMVAQYNAYGKYTVRLFDKFPEKPGGKWVKVTVDDWIPCKSGTNKPLFAQPHGDEAWVLLLEKAVAKFMGSYAALDGGHSTWAWEALTGNYVFTFKQEGPVRCCRCCGGKRCLLLATKS